MHTRANSKEFLSSTTRKLGTFKLKIFDLCSINFIIAFYRKSISATIINKYDDIGPLCLWECSIGINSDLKKYFVGGSLYVLKKFYPEYEIVCQSPPQDRVASISLLKIYKYICIEKYIYNYNYIHIVTSIQKGVLLYYKNRNYTGVSSMSIRQQYKTSYRVHQSP